ncbi:hypothetical protein FQR65_LT14908 [Abscondita terminalis]|nr:hypothetical protein FQR65_LT14908 [Abscondita terminalis]
MVNLWEEGQNDKRSDNKCFNNKLKLKRSKNRGFKIQIKGLRDLVQNLENSLSASEVGEKQLFRQFESESVKNISVVAQLNDARKENKHLLNILQQKCLEKHPTRSHTDYGSSCSTMSMVNLQYNYEELLNNHENLLKLLAIKDKDMERLCIESGNIYKKASELSSKLITCESLLKKLCSMYIELKEKKDLKLPALLGYPKAKELSFLKLFSSGPDFNDDSNRPGRRYKMKRFDFKIWKTNTLEISRDTPVPSKVEVVKLASLGSISKDRRPIVVGNQIEEMNIILEERRTQRKERKTDEQKRRKEIREGRDEVRKQGTERKTRKKRRTKRK